MVNLVEESHANFEGDGIAGELSTRESCMKTDNVDINSPSSPASFRKSLLAIANKKAGLNEKRMKIAQKIANEGDYCILKKDSITDHDMAYISAFFMNELALFRNKKEDLLLRGTIYNCIPSAELEQRLLKDGYEWVSHTHIIGGTMPSNGDRNTLKAFHQKRSRLIDAKNGDIRIFGTSVFEDE